MGFCCWSKAREAPGAYVVPRRGRGCTDVFFLMLFVAILTVVVCIWSSAEKAGGDPQKIVRGLDVDGNICGVSQATKNAPFTAWPMPTPTSYGVMICLESCNQTQTDPRMAYFYESDTFLHYCLPDPNFNISVTVTFSIDGQFDTPSNMASRAMADLLLVWPVILISAGVALVLSFLYLFFARYTIKCLVWLVIMLIIVAGAAVGYVLYQMGKNTQATTVSNRAKAQLYLGYGFWGATAIFACVIFFLRDRIAIAVGVVKEAAKSVSDMKMLIFWPIIPYLLGGGFLAFWIWVTLYIFSANRLVPEAMPAEFSHMGHSTLAGRATYLAFEWEDRYKYMFAIHFFCLLWVIQFLIYLCYMVVAAAIARWYFADRADDGEKVRGSEANEVPEWPIAAALWQTCRYHLGTVAFGSLIIAVIQFIRAVVNYIERKTRSENPNCLHKAVFCLIQCCLSCAQCCMDKISKNAFVWTSIWGDSFAVAACSSFQLLWNNLFRVAAINVVSGFIMLLGRVLVALITTALCAYYILRSYSERDINSLAMPAAVIFLLAFLVASVFMIIFETTVDTIFLCFLIDEQYNPPGKRKAPDSLCALMENEELKKLNESEAAKKSARDAPAAEPAAVTSEANT